MSRQKATNEQLLNSYAIKGNVWKVADEFGMCGQSVWERLKRLGMVDKDKWTPIQLKELTNAYAIEDTKPININDLATRIGKLKSNVSRKARELGLTTSRTRKRTKEHSLAIGLRTKQWIREHGHPRGAYKNGKEIRVCPVCGCFFEEYASRERLFCGNNCAHSHAQSHRTQGYAHTGKRLDLDSMYFRSSYEANYARYLNHLIANSMLGLIEWQYEPETFKFKNIKQPPYHYTPDFRLLFNDAHKEYHEVKGWEHPKGLVARERFEWQYHLLRLVVIRRDFFINIQERDMHLLLSGWEYVK